MSNCCAEHKEKTRWTFIRGVIFLIIGVLLNIPLVESFLLGSFFAKYFFLVATALILITLKEDFSLSLEYCSVLFMSSGIALFSPFYSGIQISLFFLVSSLLLISGQLFLVHTNSKSEIGTLYTGFTFRFPDMEKVVFLIILLNWQVSALSFFSFGPISYPCIIQEGLLLIGIFNISNWVKQSMQTFLLPHNNNNFCVKDENGNEIEVSNLKKDMIVTITDQVIMPIDCEVISQSVIEDCSSEGTKVKIEGEISKNTTYFSGVVKCLQDVVNVTHDDQRKNTESSNIYSSMLMVSILTIGIISGFWHGMLHNSIIIGMQTFCLNLVASCPCVFLVTLPIIYSKFSSWLEANNFPITFNKMPSSGQPNIIVFDRTNTLYVRDPNDINGDKAYVLNHEVKSLIKTLTQDMNIQCYILSGHGTGNWQGHHSACITEFKGLIDQKNIIFDKIYHNDRTKKREVIRNLQLYGSINQPESYIDYIIMTFKSLFLSNNVAMVGDGDNDIEAIKQSDFSICVAGSKYNFNQDVLKYSDFFTNHDGLNKLPDLLNALKPTYKMSNIFIFMSFLYNLLMLSSVNGLLGYTVPISIACLISFVFCCSMILLASQISIEIRPFKIPNQSGSVTSDCCRNNSCCCQFTAHTDIKRDCCKPSVSNKENMAASFS